MDHEEMCMGTVVTSSPQILIDFGAETLVAAHHRAMHQRSNALASPSQEGLVKHLDTIARSGGGH